MLPPGISFLEGTSGYNLYDTQRLPFRYEVIQNYKNTGKTAVIYYYDYIEANKAISVKFNLRTDLFLKSGDNLIEHYLVWNNNQD